MAIMATQFFCYVKFQKYTEKISGQNILSTDIVPHSDIKHKNGRPFEPQHNNDFKSTDTLLCKWKGCGDDETGDYDISILYMASTKKLVENWIKINKIEVQPPAVRPHIRNSNRDTKNKIPARYTQDSPTKQPPAKSSSTLNKESADAGKKKTASNEKEKISQQKHANLINQNEILKVIEIKENDSEKQTLIPQPSLEKQNEFYLTKIKKQEKVIKKLEIEIGGLQLDLDKKTREFTTLSSHYVKVTNLNSQLQEKLTTLLFEGKTLGEKPLSKDDSPPLKRSKPNPPEEGSGGMSIQHPMMETAVAVSKDVKPQVDLQSTSRDNGLIALPSTSRDGVHPSFDLDDNESSDVAVVTKTEEFEETTQPSVAQSSANSSTKDSSSSDDLWLPTWPLGKLRENDDGTLVELMNGVWLGTRQWDGIETSKDSAKFVKELAFALCGNDIANQSFTGKKSNRTSMKDEPVKPGVDEKYRKVLIGYYIQFLKKEDTLFQVQKRDKKTNELEIDLKKVNSNISSWFGEKSYSVRGKQAKKGK